MMEHGYGKHDISVWEPEMTMMGWGMRYNRVRGVGVPLHARAMVLHDPGAGTKVAFVAIETLLVTQGLWWAVLDALADDGFAAHEVILVATHTHSGPSGFGHHFWTNFNAPGFSTRVFDGLRDGIVSAVRAAWRARRPGTVGLARTTVPLGEGVAFNRSWFAYNRNVDVTPVSEARRDEATDRTLTILRTRDADGRLTGLVHWFAVHGTTVHADNVLLHPDHKGLAALTLEADGLGVVFAQECCGDVSPNYRWDRRRGHTIGRFDDDLASAAWVADVQVRHARDLLAAPEVPLTGRLEVATRFVDFARAPADGRFTLDGRAARTTPPRLGLSMAEGTAEGPGPLRRARALTRGLARIVKALSDDPKVPFLDLARGKDGRLAGLVPIERTPPLDPIFTWVRDAVRAGGVHAGPWVPEIVPIHLVRLGAFALLALPFETTTVAGRRLRTTVMDALPGVTHVVVSPYASAYVGYLTTFEEYQVQHYEAGYTLFGPHSLAAVRTAVSALAAQLGAGETTSVGPLPPRVDTGPLERIAYRGPWAR
ncbi:MAG: neutral/alkaline non-lysosomal ceramidase N-terminal domain-containing protein [Deltaproteobacteria bacterium]|nr:neutral/alkaline non-lysosomal ceramidase N-terminal domain-containing protein [Deltaproteobacteria bacterium]